MGGTAQQKIFPLFGVSKVLHFRDIAPFAVLTRAQSYQELIDDLKDKCNLHARVISIKIPRPEWKPQQKVAEESKKYDPLADEGNFSEVPGQGSAWIEFDNEDDAKTVKR